VTWGACTDDRLSPNYAATTTTPTLPTPPDEQETIHTPVVLLQVAAPQESSSHKDMAA
jgi:hypothetical protein